MVYACANFHENIPMVFQLCSGQEICALKKQREITKTTSMASVVILANDTPFENHKYC